IADESKVLNWNKITVNFKTDDNTELYLHLATSNGYDAASTSHHYIDNLTVCEVEIPDSFEKSVEYKGAAIRRGDDKTPQALRVKFEIPNSITNLYNDNGYSLKEYGALVAYDQNLNGTELNFDTSAKYFKGVAYNKEDGTNKVFATTATGSVVSFALYNIGVTNGTTDYSAYDKEFVVRPYSIYIDESGNEYIYYANSESISLFDVVDAILDKSTLESVKPSGLTGYLSDVITARNILSGEAYDAYKAAGRNIYSQNDSMGGLTLNDLGENLPIHTELQAEYLTGEYADIANFASGVAELSRPMPITFSWNDTNSTGTLYRYLLTVSENSDLSNPLVYATADNSIDIYNFKIGTDYYWNVTAIYSDGIVVSDVDKFSTEATGPRNLYISGTTNARDLGGWTINGKQTNQGVIFRSSQIDYITVEGRNTLINELGVKTEIDIRESKEAVNTLPDDLNYNAFHTKSHIFKDSKETIKKFFGVLGNKANYPIIFHCKIGTDRTGMMGFLLNALLGASEEQLYTDYLYSNFGYIAGARDREVIDGYLEVINAAEGETFAEKTYNHLVNLGVNAEHMNTFIEMMTK
ncbi:MAG: tyrosine-protein phosphatase, partial [Clostridia bacterium]|nr:tyrosine-protein phosphatase [Clostridia bacterium]